MKIRILISCFIALSIYSNVMCVQAQVVNQVCSNEVQSVQQIKFDNKIFRFKYAKLSQLTKTYMNEYFRIKENGENWTELISVFYYPNYAKPLDYAQALNKRVRKITKLETQLVYNKDTDTAVVSFLMIGKNKTFGSYVEQNLFKIEKAKNKKGISLLQYAHRYPLNTSEDAQILLKKMPTNQNKWLRQIINTPIPELVEKNYEKW